MTVIAIIASLAFLALFIEVRRAHRAQQDALTRIHGDMAAAWRDAKRGIDALRAKFDPPQ